MDSKYQRPGGRHPGGPLDRPPPHPPNPHAHLALRLFYEEVMRRGEYMTQVANRAGYNREQVRRWLRGATEPRLSDIEALLNTVGLRLTVERQDG